eukprot:3714604-Rhodomonas_salina.1
MDALGATRGGKVGSICAGDAARNQRTVTADEERTMTADEDRRQTSNVKARHPSASAGSASK